MPFAIFGCIVVSQSSGERQGQSITLLDVLLTGTF